MSVAEAAASAAATPVRAHPSCCAPLLLPTVATAPFQVLAYYAHMAAVRAARPPGAPPAVAVAAEHLAWEDFFSSQGPYADGGEQGLAKAHRRLAARLEALLRAPPRSGSSAEEDAALLIEALEASGAPGSEPAHDEL